MLTAEQLRMARAALRLTVKALAVLAGVDEGTIIRIEAGKRSYKRTLRDLREALEQQGVVFLEEQADVCRPGVALAWNAKLDTDENEADDASSGTPGSGLHSRAWDEDFDDFYALDETALDDEDREWLEFIRTNPELSDNGRRILMKDAVEQYSAKQRGDFDGLEA
jgi:transcriptional regulator with XRE-family HTH domain